MVIIKLLFITNVLFIIIVSPKNMYHNNYDITTFEKVEDDKL